MRIGAELEQYILQTHNSNKIMKIQWGFEPPSPPPPLGTPVVWFLIVDSYVVNEVFLLCIQPYLQHNDLSLSSDILIWQQIRKYMVDSHIQRL